MRGLSGRTALVTGGAGLIGSAVAKRFAEEGAAVIVGSRICERADAVARDLCALGYKAQGLAIDIGSEASIDSALLSLGEMPTILVATAIATEALSPKFNDFTQESLSRLAEVNVAGHVLCVRKLRENMSKDVPLSAVFLSSIYGMVAPQFDIYPDGMPPASIQYAAAKAATIAAARYLAAYYGRDGVRVNVVAAGGVANPDRQPEGFSTAYSKRTMLGRMATPDEIAAAVCYLASDDASYITGTCVMVDGGWTAQ